ncbi:hypothetical protein [Lysinibacillus sphaericus]
MMKKSKAPIGVTKKYGSSFMPFSCTVTGANFEAMNKMMLFGDLSILQAT